METITVLYDCGHEEEVQVTPEDRHRFFPARKEKKEPQRYLCCSPTICAACQKETGNTV